MRLQTTVLGLAVLMTAVPITTPAWLGTALDAITARAAPFGAGKIWPKPKPKTGSNPGTWAPPNRGQNDLPILPRTPGTALDAIPASMPLFGTGRISSKPESKVGPDFGKLVAPKDRPTILKMIPNTEVTAVRADNPTDIVMVQVGLIFSKVHADLPGM